MGSPTRLSSRRPQRWRRAVGAALSGDRRAFLLHLCRRGGREPGHELGARHSTRAGWRATGVLRSQSGDGCRTCGRHARNHRLNHGDRTPPTDGGRRRCLGLECVQPGCAPRPGCRRGGPDRPAPKGHRPRRDRRDDRRRGVLAQCRRAGLGRSRAERRLGGLARLCGAPRRAPEHLGSLAPARDVDRVAQHGDRRGGERA